MALALVNNTGKFLAFATPTMGTAPFCMGGWCRHTSDLGNGRGVFGNTTSPTITVFRLGLNVSEQPEASIRVGAQVTVTAAAVVAIDTWVHLCLVRRTDDGGTLRLYVDGVEVGSAAASTGAIAPDPSTVLGKIRNTASEFDGDIAWPFFDGAAAIEPHQAAALARGMPPGRVIASPTLHWWPLAAAGDQLDAAGVLTATQTGSPAWSFDPSGTYRGRRRMAA